jgi:NDP-sugar pyrophosphorylase family protein
MNALAPLPCVILAGGKGTRLGRLTAGRPKSLVPVGGRPFLEHQIDLLRESGVAKIVLCIGHYGRPIEEFCGDGERWGVRISYSREKKSLLGTAGALRQAARLLPERFFVLYGDSYTPVDFSSLARAHASSGRPVLMAVFRNRSRWDRSNVLFRAGAVIRYTPGGGETGPEFIDYGLSVFSRGVLDEIPAVVPSGLPDFFARLAREGRLAGFEAKRRFFEIGSPAGIQDFERFLGRRMAGQSAADRL